MPAWLAKGVEFIIFVISSNLNIRSRILAKIARWALPGPELRNGTLMVSGTHHIIYSVGFATQQLNMKVLNNITWQKPNPPPNLSCRYFTHSTETIIWAAKNEKSKHKFNYDLMKNINEGKQKLVSREKLKYGVSITDCCISIENTNKYLIEIHALWDKKKGAT